MEIERISTKKLSRLACINVPCSTCNSPFDADRGYVWYNTKNGNRVCYDCAEKKYGVRKERFEWFLPRRIIKKKSNNTFCHEVCYACEHKFNADRDYIWKESKKGRYICYECAEAKVTYRQQYGFWLRGFASEHFIPCEKCQDRLHEMMMTMTVAFHTQECITVETVAANDKIVWQFLLRFLTRGSSSNKQVFRPCKECQKKLKKIWETKELHIGNENKPVVELWRKMNQVISKLDN